MSKWRIDWSNPLTRSLEVAAVPFGTHFVNLVTSVRFPGQSGVPGIGGRSYRSVGYRAGLSGSSGGVITLTLSKVIPNTTDISAIALVGGGWNSGQAPRAGFQGNGWGHLYVGGVSTYGVAGTSYTPSNYQSVSGTSAIFPTVYGPLHCIGGYHKYGTGHGLYVNGHPEGTPYSSAATRYNNTNQFVINSGTSGSCAFAAGWSRALSAYEFGILAENPWQLFAPNLARSYFFGTASTPSSTTYPWTATGGATLSGAATLAKVKNFVGTGSMSLDGSASLAKWKNFVGTGGATLTGTATTSGPSNAYGYLYFMSRPRVSGVRPV